MTSSPEQAPTVRLAGDLSGGAVGSYRLAQRIGEGGMGVVYLALDADQRAVAIKVLRPHVAGDPDARARLAREVATLRRVRHERIAQVLDADVDGSLPYVATEYVLGTSLDGLVRDHGALAGADLLRLAFGLGDALGAIHGAGVIHRDLKPANVMMRDGEPVVIDFGIAHIADDSRLTHTGLVMGTPGYLSPELLEGASVDRATDWWGWAATLAFAGTGRPPFGKGPMEVVLDRVRRGEADLQGVPVPLEPVLRSALSPDPSARPRPAELRAALNQARAELLRPVVAPEPSRPAVAPGPSRTDAGTAAHARTEVVPATILNRGTRETAASTEPAATQVAAVAATRAAPVAATRVVPAESVPAVPPTQVSSIPPTRVQPVAQPQPQYAQPPQPMVNAAGAGTALAAPPPPPAGWPQRAEPRYVQAPPAYLRHGQPAPGHAPGQAPASRHAQAPSGYAQPGHAQPGHAQPGHAQPGHARPGYGGEGHQQPPRQPGRLAHRFQPTPQRVQQPARRPVAPPEQARPVPPTPAPQGPDSTRRPARRGTMFCALLAIIAGFVAAPLLTAAAVVALSVLARLFDRTAWSVLKRRHLHGGRRRSDPFYALAVSPLQLLAGAFWAAMSAILPAVLGVSAFFAASLLVPTDGVGIDSLVSPAAAGGVFALAHWWGPGGASMRRGSRLLARSVTPGTAGSILAVLLLLGLAAGLLLLRAQAGAPEWFPLQGDPLLQLIGLAPAELLRPPR